jgi:hypothetical protein
VGLPLWWFVWDDLVVLIGKRWEVRGEVDVLGLELHKHRQHCCMLR